MREEHQDLPAELKTDGGRSIFVDCEGPEDTTVRPARFHVPRPWPEDVPRPKPPSPSQDAKDGPGTDD